MWGREKRKATGIILNFGTQKSQHTPTILAFSYNKTKWYCKTFNWIILFYYLLKFHVIGLKQILHRLETFYRLCWNFDFQNPFELNYRDAIRIIAFRVWQWSYSLTRKRTSNMKMSVYRWEWTKGRCTIGLKPELFVNDLPKRANSQHFGTYNWIGLMN